MLSYFWIAEFSDGTALSQFDLESGKENDGDPKWLPSKNSESTGNERGNFAEKKISRFGWYPFNFALASMVYKATSILAMPSGLKEHIITLASTDRLIAYRATISKKFRYHICTKCGYRWQLTKRAKDPLINLPTSDNVFVEEIDINTQHGPRKVKYLSAICPGCSYHDCNDIMIKDKKVKVLSSEISKTNFILGKVGEKVQIIAEDGSVTYGD